MKKVFFSEGKFKAEMNQIQGRDDCYTSTLVIDNLVSDDMRIYKLMVENVHGTDTKDFKLLIQG